MATSSLNNFARYLTPFQAFIMFYLGESSKEDIILCKTVRQFIDEFEKRGKHPVPQSTAYAQVIKLRVRGCIEPIGSKDNPYIKTDKYDNKKYYHITEEGKRLYEILKCFYHTKRIHKEEKEAIFIDEDNIPEFLEP